MTIVDEAALLVLEIEQELPNIKGVLPMPNPIDERCSRIIQLYVAHPTARAAIRSAGTLEQYRIMLGFSSRMAVVSVRASRRNLLFESLVAHVVEDFRWDPRDNFLVLALVHHSAGKLGMNSAALFERAANMASTQAAEYLLQAPLSLASCGVTEVEGPDGFDYKCNW